MEFNLHKQTDFNDCCSGFSAFDGNENSSEGVADQMKSATVIDIVKR